MQKNVTESTTATPYTPQHYPFAETINRTLLYPVRVLLERAGLFTHCWDCTMWYGPHI